MADLKRLNVRLRPALYDFLKTSAEERGLSMNAMIILALETYLQQQVVTDNMGDLLKAYNELHEKNNQK